MAPNVDAMLTMAVPRSGPAVQQAVHVHQAVQPPGHVTWLVRSTAQVRMHAFACENSPHLCPHTIMPVCAWRSLTQYHRMRDVLCTIDLCKHRTATTGGIVTHHTVHQPPE